MTLKGILRVVFATFLIFAGVSHLYAPDFFLPMMPPYLPWHIPLILISGIFEILLAAMILHPKYRRVGGLGAVLLLIAVFPANVNMALNPGVFPSVPLELRWIRLPFQLLFILWVVWVTKEEADDSSRSTRL